MALRVVCYLKSHPGQSILFLADSPLIFIAYCDSNWASCPNTRRSVTGYFVSLGGSPISWKTKKHIPSLDLLQKLNIIPWQSLCVNSNESASYFLICISPFAGPFLFHCDSQSALHIAINHVFHKHSKTLKLIVILFPILFEKP